MVTSLQRPNQVSVTQKWIHSIIHTQYQLTGKTCYIIVRIEWKSTSDPFPIFVVRLKNNRKKLQ